MHRTKGENKDDDDYVQNYSEALKFRGLYDMVMENAVKEADGDAMMQLWSINLLDFWTNKHPEYLIQGTRLLAGFTYIHKEMYEKKVFTMINTPYLHFCI